VRAMTEGSPTLPRDPELPLSLDFFALRRASIKRISELGSELWTDYNSHDPGITLLEALLYAITDLAHRARWSIRDLLAQAEDQAFYPAHEILTVRPVTPDDYRRLLIDLEGVRNAWVACKQCACGAGNVKVGGLYDIRVELDEHAELGDLNDRLVTGLLEASSRGETREIVVETRFPRVELADDERFAAFLADEAQLQGIACIRLSAEKSTRSRSSTLLDDEGLRRHWREVLYATLEVTSSAGMITFQDVALRLLPTDAGRAGLQVNSLVDWLEDPGDTSPVGFYRLKRRAAAAVLGLAKSRYHGNRNLDEDLCLLDVVDVGQVAVCAEIEVDPAADLEWVQAKAWRAIEDYLAPPVPFYSLAELLREGVAVEDIFNGPPLANGFIKQSDLDAAGLRNVVRASDLIHLLMGIEGVRSVSDLLLTRYDEEGQPVHGAADPRFVEGEPEFDAQRLSASWLLYMGEGRQPRLYRNLSNFKFKKNGLPFSVRQDEALDVLVQLRGADERPKLQGAANTLPMPHGTARNAADISPVQDLLPFAYGVGPAGLPSHVGQQRRDQAKQLKAYLMVFEQWLGNAFEQVAHVGDLFSLSSEVEATYFAHDFSAQVTDHGAISLGLDPARLARLCESPPEFLERRNKFLDHLLARFGLDVGQYALLLTNWKGESVGRRDLIEDKLAVLRSYALISSARAKAFDRRPLPSALDEEGSILKRRVALLLGHEDLRFAWTWEESGPAVAKTRSFELLVGEGEVWGEGTLAVEAPTKAGAAWRAQALVLRRMSRASSYAVGVEDDGRHVVRLEDSGTVLAAFRGRFATRAEALAFVDELVATGSMARAIVVEHLLLRPKFPGDAVYRECGECEEADPWSFRLTLVQPGWIAPYNTQLEWRGFANRTIQEEVPSHLLPKVCWVGDRGHEADPCDPVVDALTEAIRAGARTADGMPPDCRQASACALAAYEAHARAFAVWYSGGASHVVGMEATSRILEGVFAPLSADNPDCTLDLTAVWSELRSILLAHFTDIALHGYQFSRLEDAWLDWLEADSRMDWSDERLVERLEALLAGRRADKDDSGEGLCACAERLLKTQGEAFSLWMGENLERGRPLEEFSSFVPPAVELCEGITFRHGTERAVAEFLAARYGRYVEVSYRLARLVRLLEKLSNTYPPATLHDCEDGGDVNPVRLDQSALGTLTAPEDRAPDEPPRPERPPSPRSSKRPRKRKR
jgi:hypothetical protein